MKNTLITFDDLSIEALTKNCREAFNDIEDVFFIVEANLNRLETFGRLLTAAKSKVPHGQWEDWITDTFEGRLNPRTARRWMSDSKRTKMAVLESESSGNSGEVPRESRKPGRVAVVDQDDKDDDDDDSEIIDDDPTPDPPTQRKTAASSQKVKEADKPKPRPVVAEVLTEEPVDGEKDAVNDYLRIVSPVQILRDVLTLITDDGLRVKEVRRLRKELDKFDPPDETSAIPKASALKAHIPEDLPESIDSALWQFVKLKQAYKDRKWRYQSADQFAGDMKRLKNKLKALGEAKVERMLLDAFDKGWRHWDHDLENGKANGNVRSREQEREKRNADSFAIFERAAEERDAARLG